MKPIRIIMTNCKSHFGSWYVLFREKETGLRVGEIDRVSDKYVIFSGPCGQMEEIATRTKKQSAIKVLQDHLRENFTAPLEFKWNVMCQSDRFV